MALLILGVMAWYGLIKANILLNHENPNVSTFVEQFVIESYE